MYYGMTVKSYGSRAASYEQAGLDRRGELATEKRDGDLLRVLPVANWTLSRFNRETGAFDEVRDFNVFCELYVTNCRVAVRCKRYNKDSHDSPFALDFLGIFSSVLGMMADVWPRIAELRERRRNAMVGHLRYEWLSDVGFTPEQGLERGHVRLVFKNADGDECYYDFKMLRGIDAGFVAHEILRNLGAYRLQMRDNKTPEEIAFLQECASGTQRILPATSKKRYAMIHIPGSYRYPTGQQFQPVDI
jgi:hypothetical protein